MSAGREFHSGMVRGKKENLYWGALARMVLNLCLWFDLVLVSAGVRISVVGTVARPLTILYKRASRLYSPPPIIKILDQPLDIDIPK